MRPKVHFTGCTHFDHARIIKLANRPFNNVEIMNEVLVENWNARVRPEDTVYHLGDFSWWGSSARDPEFWINQLNGRKTFIQGNHDRIGFGDSYMAINVEGQKIVLFHYPIEEWDAYYRQSIHLHCHTHKPDLISAPGRFNVGVDACNFRPISFDEIMEAHETALKKA